MDLLAGRVGMREILGFLKIGKMIWILGYDFLLMSESVRRRDVRIVSDKEVLVLACWGLD